MVKHLAKTLAPVHNGSSKTVVYVIYGVLALIFSITIFAFNNAEYAKNETTVLKCQAIENKTNIVTLKEGQKEMVSAMKEMNNKLDVIMQRVK